MPILRLTQKLQKELGLKAAALESIAESPQPFAEWYAHIFFVNRRKQVIFVEHQTLFSFTCVDVSRKDLRERLPELFEKGLGKALFDEGAGGALIGKILNVCRDGFHYAKTVDRRTIGAINQFVFMLKDYAQEPGWSGAECDRRNRMMPCKGFPGGAKDYLFPMEVFAAAARDRFREAFTIDKKGNFQSNFSDGPGAQDPAGQLPGKVYVFEAVLKEGITGVLPAPVVRELAVEEDSTLADLAEEIIGAFDFNFDHCYGFYSDTGGSRRAVPDEVYELFVDICEEPTREHARGVEKTGIVEVYAAIGKRMRFLFDYGDDWEFWVTLKEIRTEVSPEILPRVIRAEGKAPPQYPVFE